jgi:hypothetical protein
MSRLSRARALAPLALLLFLAPAAHARPKQAERLRQCEAHKSHPKYQCYSRPEQPSGKTPAASLLYGWNVGTKLPRDESDPPSYALLLNGLDQCAWFFDRGAWKWNPRSEACETKSQCSNALGLFRCYTAFKPQGKVEEAAQRIALRAITRRSDTCIRSLYKEYGVEFAPDEHGASWLSPRSIEELAEAFEHCPPDLPAPGWDQAAARKGQQK